MIPSILALKSKVFELLTGDVSVSALADVGAAHPLEPSKVTPNKGFVAITQVYDLQEGTVITRNLLYPWLQFACWDISDPRATRLLEAVVNCIESWTAIALQSPGQKVNSINRRRRNGPFFDDKTQLFVASVDVGFKLSTF